MHYRRSLALGLAALFALTAVAPGLAAAGEPDAVPAGFATAAATSSVVTKVVPYYRGTTLTWKSFNQYGLGSPAAGDTTRLNGVAGGAMGIVITGSDLSANEAASWVSKDAGRTWTEHITPSRNSFGEVVGRGGVLVTTGGRFHSSTDGAVWIEATTGPQDVGRVTLRTGPSGFVAFSRPNNGPTRVWRSVNGRTWSVVPLQTSLSGFCATSMAASSTRIVAIGYDCKSPSRPRVLISSTGLTWTSVAVPSGLRVSGTYTRWPSVSYVSGRFLVTGANATQTATWVWSSMDGRAWRHIASMPRTTFGSFTTDTMVGIFKMGSGYVAIGHRDMPADDAVLVAWRSTDLVHWSRFSPAVGPCSATVHMVSQAALIRGQLIAVGTPWSIGGSCGETWMAAVTN